MGETSEEMQSIISAVCTYLLRADNTTSRKGFLPYQLSCISKGKVHSLIALFSSCQQLFLKCENMGVKKNITSCFSPNERIVGYQVKKSLKCPLPRQYKRKKEGTGRGVPQLSPSSVCSLTDSCTWLLLCWSQTELLDMNIHNLPSTHPFSSAQD